MRATFYKVVNECPENDNIPGHMLAILAHDQLQGVLMLLKSCPEFLVLLLQRPDVPEIQICIT